MTRASRMVTIIIAILLLLAFLLIWIDARRAGLSILACGIIIFYCCTSGLIPNLLLDRLQIPFSNQREPVWGVSNAIVLLGSGTVKIPSTEHVIPGPLSYARINTAASLYFNCQREGGRCVIIVSGGDAVKTGASEAEVYQKNLIQLGIPTDGIIMENRSMNTYQNAQFTVPILKQGKFDKVILVTSALHLQRSIQYFLHFGMNTLPYPAGFVTARVSVWPSAANLMLTELAFHEYAGIVRLHMYDMFGWNSHSSSPGAV